MIQGEIIQNIKKYEPKFIGPFTIRQFVCVVISAVFVLGIYFSLKWLLVTEALLTVCVLIAMPFIACGWIAPYGVPLEKFVISLIKSKMLVPLNRKYKTNPKQSDIGDVFRFETDDVIPEEENIESSDIDSSGAGEAGIQTKTVLSKKEKKKVEKAAIKKQKAEEVQLAKDIKALGPGYKPYD